jgi:hypothetical protein
MSEAFNATVCSGTGLSAVDFKDRQFGDAEMAAFLDGVRRSPWDRLCLTGNRVGPATVKAIVNFLASDDGQIAALELRPADVPSEMGDLMFDFFGHHLEKCPVSIDLDFRGTASEDEFELKAMAESIGRIIEGDGPLAELRLSGHFTLVEVHRMLEGRSRNSHLRRFEIHSDLCAKYKSPNPVLDVSLLPVVNAIVVLMHEALCSPERKCPLARFFWPYFTEIYLPGSPNLPKWPSVARALQITPDEMGD